MVMLLAMFYSEQKLHCEILQYYFILNFNTWQFCSKNNVRTMTGPQNFLYLYSQGPTKSCGILLVQEWPCS